MSWLLPSVVASSTGTLFLAVLYVYLYLQDRNTYMLVWAGSWTMYLIRFLFMFLYIILDGHQAFLIGNQLSSLISGFLLLWGTFVYLEKTLPRIWIIAAALCAMWIVLSISLQFGFMVMSLPTFLFMAITNVFTGTTIIRARSEAQLERWITGIAFIVWGLHKADYPFLRPVTWFAPFGYLLGAILELVVAIGIVFIYFKRTRYALHTSTLNLRAVISTIPDLVWLKDEDGKYLLCNRRFERLYGANESEIIGKTDYDFVDPGLAESFRIHDRRAMASDEPNVNEEIVRYKDDGHEEILETVKTHLHDENGKIIGVLGIARDITERKQTENRFRKLIEISNDGVAIIRPGGVIVDVNDALCTITGYTRNELIGSSLLDLNTDDSREESDCHLKSLLESISHRFETRYTRKDGTLIDAEVSAVYTEDVDGIIFAFIRDVTERKAADLALRESEKLLRSIAEHYPHSYVSIVEKDMTIGFTSGQEFKNRNIDPSRYIGLSIDEVFGEHADTIKRYYEKTFQGTEQSFELLYDGQIQLYKTIPIYSEDRSIQRILTVVENITDRKKLEHRVQQVQKIESIGALAGGIAHDFNNILFPIIGVTELLLDDLPETDAHYQDIREIHQAGTRGVDLVRRILTLSRKSEVHMEPVRVQAILTEVLQLARSTIPANIELDTDIEADCRSVLADSTQLHQVAMNLITNAFHAVEQTSGKIVTGLHEVELTPRDCADKTIEPGRYAILTVSDNGHGIDPEIMNYIFDPYFTTKQLGKGTGLGLSTVLGIVKNHHGDIKISSRPGVGTTVVVYLPIIDTAAVESGSDTHDSHPTGTEHILLIDDDASIIRLESELLRRLGYTITSFTSPTAAVENFENHPRDFDLVISDMTMPDMTGDQLAQRLIEIRTDIPIIICTGYSERINEESAVALGIKRLLVKPIIMSGLSHAVREVLDERDSS